MALKQLGSVLQEALHREAKNYRRYEMPISRRLWLYRQQFTSSRNEIYEFSRHDVDDFLTDLQNVRARGLNDPNTDALRNTTLFSLTVSRNFPEVVPDILGVLTGDGDVVPYPGGGRETVEDIIEAARSGPLVVKPVRNSGGEDVHLIEPDETGFLFDGQAVTEAELTEIIGSVGRSVVQERVQQASYARTIYPDVANTIRVLTMVDPESKEPFIAAVAHRFGASSTGNVDNWSSGGLSARIDPETGTLGEAVVSTYADSSGRKDHHPDTGARLVGEQIPSWGRVRDKLLEIAGTYRGLWTYVGWDLILEDDGGNFALIEGNDWPDIRVHQAHEPLLADDRVRRFYEHHDVL